MNKSVSFRLLCTTIPVFLLLIVVSFSLHASSEYTGMRAAEFLTIGIGARQAAMGDAASALCDDISSMYWNPAGLALIKERQGAFSHAFWIGDTNYDFLAYCQPVEGIGSLGFGISSLFYGNLIGRDDSGGRTADFTACDLACIFSYAADLSSRSFLGLNLKYIQQTIESESGNAWALDAGFLLKPFILEDLDFACQVRNIGFGLEVSGASYPLPYSTRVGASYKLLGDNLTVACDVDIPSIQDMTFHIGGEYWQEDMIAFRMGYNTANVESLGGVTGVSAGLGFRYSFGSPGREKTLNIDYAFVPYGGELMGANRLSVILKF